MAKVTATIRGQVVSADTVRGWNKSAENMNNVFGSWANYGAVCAVFHDGLDVLNNMVKNSALTLSTGKLSALGRQVVDYVLAHAGQFVRFDSKVQAFAFVQFKGENKTERKAAARVFVDPRAVDSLGAPAIKVTAQRDENGVNPSAVDFALTFAEFREFTKPKKVADDAQGIKVETVTKGLEKSIKAISEAAGMVGTAADFVKALEQLEALRVELTKAGAVALAKEETARADIASAFLPAQQRADDGVTLKGEAA
ncbi:hypothetical protein OF001_U20273 [Pseudomonas sp. OF001]|uniref:hypothetical protein n=1 Tax=Pseudomonas sp. OF001 TaxID=2772300 RepID=UPI00191B56AB|nr:hypothetical protein [Pseudomonas sp. OF001]CAD5377346.1 hypothetical protein OF001_U20273 [Pseudomonas sp. OF001]